MKKMIYAVRKGRKTGIFNEWLQCYEQTNRYPNAKFRRFEYRSELEEAWENVPGSLRHAIKEAEEYLEDLVYLGEGDDYLEEESWEEEGYLPFGDPSEAEDRERIPDESEPEEEEEYGKTADEEYDRWLAGNRNADTPAGYWRTAEDMAGYADIIHDREHKQSMEAKRAAADKLKELLNKCRSDVNLYALTAVYRDKEQDNAIGYDAPAVASFISRMLRAYPKPTLPEMEKMAAEEDVSMQQLLMQVGAMESELRDRVVGQDAAIEKLRAAYFDRELTIRLQPNMRGPRSVYLLAGPPGVGKTFMAQQFAFKLGFPFKRFDMSGYSNKESIQELVGFARTWMNSEPGTLAEFVTANPKCVLLFDEVEKAHITVIRMFLQILDDGFCEDKYHKQDISFKNVIIFFTTNAGRQLYSNARKENLTLFSDKVVIDALEKDKDPETKRPFFPPEILSRMSSHTILMLNHLKADAIYKLVKKDIKARLRRIKKKDGYELEWGDEYLTRTVLYSMGGSADARNASKAAGKLINKEIYELLKLVAEKQGLDESGMVKKIEWKCDLEGAADEIRELYFGETDCVIPVFGTVKYKPAGKIKDNRVHVKNTTDIKEFMEMIHKEKVLFAVIDYIYGHEKAENGLSVVDAGAIGRDAFQKLREEDKEIPVYILDGSRRHDYTEKEKIALMKRGVGGFIESRYFEKQLEQAYMDVCCQVVMETLTARHQVLTYETRKEYDEKTNAGSIIFCSFRLETAVDSEDRSAVLADDLRPDKGWDDIYVSEDLKRELEFFIQYLRNPKKYNKKGVKPRGILLYGPPGTGKTSLAKVAASESGVNFLSISASELSGGGPEMVHDEFRIARKYAPAILFIDEIDAIGMERKNFSMPNPVLNALLTEMDGFATIDNKPVFVMAATNLGSRIDFALQRRFDRSFEMGYLDQEGIRWLLEKQIKKHSDMFHISDKEMESIVVRSVGRSPAKLEQVVEAALREGIRSDRIIDDNLFDEMFEKSILGEEKAESSSGKMERTAYHEAGHALIDLYYGRPPAYMSIVARGGHGGYVLFGTEERDLTKEYYLERICAVLGGRAAEMAFDGSLTYGAVSDLKQATDIARDMVCRFGMYEKEIGLAVIEAEELKYNEKARELINRILSEQLETATDIIKANQDAMRRLAEAAMKNGKKYLTGKEILETAGRLAKIEKRMLMKKIQIHTDGACSGNPGPGGWAAIILDGGREEVLSGGEDAPTTNNRMELMAVVQALEALDEPCDVELYSDSRYVVDSVEKHWAENWRDNQWMKPDGEPALHIDLWKRLLKLCGKHKVRAIWEEAHAGNTYNDRCDQLAVAEAERRKDK
ncbi:MAG: ribonuclease HI [Blautia sp.]|nr:ribonuclease HI [Blautia sp.]